VKHTDNNNSGIILKRGKKYLVKESPRDKTPMTCKWYGYKQDIESWTPDGIVTKSGHLFLYVGASDSGVILTEEEVQKYVSPWTKEAHDRVTTAALRSIARQ
jgi:hypothetical protein